MTQPGLFGSDETLSSGVNAQDEQCTKLVEIDHRPVEVKATPFELEVLSGKKLRFWVIEDSERILLDPPKKPRARRQPDLDDCPNPYCTGVCASCKE